MAARHRDQRQNQQSKQNHRGDRKYWGPRVPSRRPVRTCSPCTKDALTSETLSRCRTLRTCVRPRSPILAPRSVNESAREVAPSRAWQLETHRGLSDESSPHRPAGSKLGAPPAYTGYLSAADGMELDLALGDRDFGAHGARQIMAGLGSCDMLTFRGTLPSGAY
jgi:hypothetical protein